MKPFEQQTYYELLEIPVSAPEEEILAAYARALETYSPESVAVYMLVDPGQVDALRARLTEAMEILTEPDLRAEYDRMIGVSRAESSAVTALAPALAAAAQAVQSQEPSKAPSAPAPEATPTAETPAPAVVATPAAPEPVPAPTTAPAEPAASPTPAMPPASFVMSGIVSPSQIHAAFRSYAISYVPVLVPAPSLTSSAVVSPFTPPGPVDAPPPGPEAPAPEAAAARAPVPSAEPVPPTASAPVSLAEAATQGSRAPAPSPVAAASVEPAAASSASTASAAAEPPRAIPSSAPVEPAHPPDLAAEPPTPQLPTNVLVHHEEDELSGVRAPLPSRGEARAAASPPAGTPPSPRGRPVRPVPTPPPLPPGGRRVTRVPGPQPATPPADAGKGSARPGQGPGMDLEEAQQLAQESAIATAEAALAQVAAKAREPRPKPVELPPNAEFNGEVLRQVRESRGLSLAQLAERTRISSKHLENVEADRYTALPATVYLRGILMNIARELGLDPLKVSRSYLTLATGPKKK